MNTFLPTAYNFSLNQLLNYNDYHNGMMIKIVVGSIVSILIGLVVGFVAFALLCPVHDDNEHDETSSNAISASVFGCALGVVAIICFSFVPWNQDQWRTNAFVEQDFRYPATHNNFIVKCASSSHNENDNIPQSFHDNKNYPYKLYVKKDNGTKYCLGTMKNGQFIPTKTYAAVVFYKYIQYINKHHLKNKFTNNVYFIKSNKYLDGKNIQWILTNKHDTVLHLADNTVVEQSNIVEN